MKCARRDAQRLSALTVMDANNLTLVDNAPLTYLNESQIPRTLGVRTCKLHRAKLQKTNSSLEYKAVQDQRGTDEIGTPEAGMLRRW